MFEGRDWPPPLIVYIELWLNKLCIVIQHLHKQFFFYRKLWFSVKPKFFHSKEKILIFRLVDIRELFEVSMNQQPINANCWTQIIKGKIPNRIWIAFSFTLTGPLGVFLLGVLLCFLGSWYTYEEQILLLNNNHETIQFPYMWTIILLAHFSAQVHTSNRTVLLVFLLLVIVLPFVVSTSYSWRVTWPAIN